MYFNFHKILFSGDRVIKFSCRKNRTVKHFTKLSQIKFKVLEFYAQLI